jgi:hypothetical protein
MQSPEFKPQYHGGKKKKEQNPKNQFQRNTQTAKGGLTLFLKVFVFWQHWGLN